MRLGDWGWSQCRGIQREVIDRNTYDTNRWYRKECIGDRSLTFGGVRHLVDPDQAVADLEHVISKWQPERYRFGGAGEGEGGRR